MADQINNFVVLIRISSGYTTRTFISSLKQLSNTARWFFFDNKFVISDISGCEGNDVSVIFSEATFSSDKLSHYIFNRDLVIPKASEFWVRSVNVGEMTTQLSSVTKTESLEIIINSSGNFIIRPCGNGNKNETNFIHTVIASDPEDNILTEYNEFPIPEDKPTCKIPTVDFQKMCGGFKKGNRDTSVIFKLSAGNDGILVQPTSSSGSGRIQTFGNYTQVIKEKEIADLSNLLGEIKISPAAQNLKCQIECINKDDNDNYKINVPMTVLKAMSKISTIAPMSIVQLYMTKDNPLKIKVPIGTAGEWRMYVRKN